MIFAILSFVIIIAGTILIGLNEYSGKEIKKKQHPKIRLFRTKPSYKDEF